MFSIGLQKTSREPVTLRSLPEDPVSKQRLYFTRVQDRTYMEYGCRFWIRISEWYRRLSEAILKKPWRSICRRSPKSLQSMEDFQISRWTEAFFDKGATWVILDKRTSIVSHSQETFETSNIQLQTFIGPQKTSWEPFTHRSSLNLHNPILLCVSKFDVVLANRRGLELSPLGMSKIGYVNQIFFLNKLSNDRYIVHIGFVDSALGAGLLS